VRKGNDVFLLTLVDLLLQLLFLGLVLFAVHAARRSRESARNADLAAAIAALDSIRESKGYSSIAELTDSLTRLAPVSVDSMLRLVGEVGSIDSLTTLVNKARRGSGLPACISRPENGRETPIPIARIVAWDDSVLVTSIGDSLNRVMREAKLEPSPSAAVPLSMFRRRFGGIVKANCRFHAVWVERTRFVDARDTVGIAFTRVTRQP